MRVWSTYIYAKCPVSGDMKKYGGQNIHALTKRMAHDYCQKNGLGYLHISDEVIMEIPCRRGTLEPDFNNAIDYSKTIKINKMKIEKVIDSCHECRYMQKVQEMGGNTFFAGICAHGIYEGNMDKPHPFTVVATSTNRNVFNNPISIPNNCPLETK